MTNTTNNKAKKKIKHKVAQKTSSRSGKLNHIMTNTIEYNDLN